MGRDQDVRPGPAAGLDGLAPGAALVVALESLSPAALAGEDLAAYVRACARVQNRGTARLLDGMHHLGRAEAGRTAAPRARNDLIDRLPAVGEALWEGWLDEPKAVRLCEWTRDLTEDHARHVCQVLLPEAPTLPVGELIRRIEQTAAALDPEWAQRRAQRAEKNARVILSPNPSGTATLSVCDVAAPAGLAMRDRVDALAAAVRRLGVLTPVSTLRAAVAARLLDGSVAGLDDRVVALVLATEYHGSGPAGQDPEPGDGPADGDGPDPDDDPDTGPDDDPDTGPDDDGGSDDDGGPDDDGLHVPRDGGAAADEHDDHAPVDDGPDEYGPGEDATGEDATGDDSAEADAAATGGAGRPGPARPARSRSARARTTLLAALDPDDHGEWGPCSPSSATGSAVSGCAPACPRPRTPTTWPEGVREPRSAGGSGSATGTASRPAADGPPTTPTSTTPWPAASAGPRCHWNLGVFDRHHHRAKHHAGWRVRQPRPGHFEIRTRARVKHITTPKPIIDPLPRPRPAARPRPLRDDGRHPDAPDDDGTAEDGTADGSTDDRTSDHRPTSAAGRPTARPTATPVGRPEPPATEDATDDPPPF